ncbi:penicillin-binding protein 1A [Limimonas halophila]|uniref:Penicillin-binding protein 1A n=1 Tax=Limimonas halophila TaxID=1082479 RepID=A0A1G7LXW7_9PROT|nr:penicillin-binding protein 1A [Limimonas halophila]SDF53789.1 penicillin-binding protein 1A [Limimonas halophila]
MRTLGYTLVTLVLLGVIATAGAVSVMWYFGRHLPDYQALAQYEPPTVSRVHAGDGRLLAEYAEEKRIFVPIESIPRKVVHAFVAAEDQNFFDHAGVDPLAIVRAGVTNLKRMGTNQRPVGASTITQQVAKNFLLSDRVSIRRKIREAILALKIEHTFDKSRILELYLNEIYLGAGSYGVAAAALNYFNTSLDELTMAQAAYLAALPKGPANYHPREDHRAALARRNWVISRMHEEGYITADRAREARDEPLRMRERAPAEVTDAPYFAAEVRDKLVERYGRDKLFTGGLSVRTTVDPDLQDAATSALREGLIAYDRRHGWRGAQRSIELPADWAARLSEMTPPEGLPDEWRQAAVLKVRAEDALLGFADGTTGRLPMSAMRWARPALDEQYVGEKPDSPGDVVSQGDVVLVSPAEAEKAFALEQMPAVNGGIVALDPRTGRVLAMQGGFDFARTQFNRVTQAKRQPGSAFKPFVYLTALENGLTPATMVLDAPFVIDQGDGLGKWKPANHTEQFYGPTPMRVGIEQSRNLMTVRIAQTVGMKKVAKTAESFGLYDDLPEQLSMSIGAGETTLLRLASAYASFANGGMKVTPKLIDRVQDRRGSTIYRPAYAECPDCKNIEWSGQEPPTIRDTRKRLTDRASAYQVVSMLRGVVERGTGRRMRALDRPVAGKTGTTNDSHDTWFMGFTPNLVAGVYVGFDSHRTLGAHAYGSNVAGPIFKDFMARALEGEPAIPFRVPPGIHLTRMDLDTGRPAGPDSETVVLEAFKAGNSPSGERRVLDAGTPGSYSNGGNGSSGGSSGGTSGLY